MWCVARESFSLSLRFNCVIREEEDLLQSCECSYAALRLVNAASARIMEVATGGSYEKVQKICEAFS